MDQARFEIALEQQEKGSVSEKNPWVDVEEALRRVPRSKRTLQRCVPADRVRTWRPYRKSLFYLSDLLKAERETRRKGLR